MQKCKFLFYKVFIDKVTIEDGTVNYINRLELELNEPEFNAINLSVFIELGLVVTVHKIYEDGKIQNPE